MKSEPAPGGLWSNSTFQKLYWAHVVSLVGAGVSSVALGLLAHALVGASASAVLGYTLAIRIAVIVLCSPWAGHLSQRFGARATMIWSDLFRVAIVGAFFLVDAVWQIYVLAVFLNLGSALFTPIYKAVIPGTVSGEDYPRALAFGSVAYDTSRILGPALAGLLIATIGFRGAFLFDAGTFLFSAFLVIALPRIALDAPKATTPSRFHGIGSMCRRKPLRESLLLAIQISVAGAFVLVATIDFVKSELALPDRYYAWAMALYGVGSVCGALGYSHGGSALRTILVSIGSPLMIASFVFVGVFQSYSGLLLAWAVVGAAQSILGVRGNELLATNSGKAERAHIYAAHFALSHVGWGVTYPLAGVLTSRFGFSNANWVFVCLLIVVSTPYWLIRIKRK